MIKKRGFLHIFIFVFLILITGIFLVSSAQNNKDKVNYEVYLVLEENEKVPVKIEMEKTIFSSKNKVKKEITEKEIIFETSDEIIVNINKNELEEIKLENNVKSISFAPQYKIFLEDSVPHINASAIWSIKHSNQNLTGINETICIIDTGINFSHVDLVGKNKTCIIDCYNKVCVENCSIHDDNGHGTHVAGIAAANGAIRGVAIGANLIGVKVLDKNGDANATTGTIDIKNAIDWCVANRVAYNISVISMSLGTTTLYTNYCDATFNSTLTKAINNATMYNVSVVVSTGNVGSTTQISSPACIENSIAVGSIGNDDSTFAYNRNNITDLMAPGININSTFAGGTCLVGCSCSGNYMTCSGTSMSTPHVAGAFALFRQFFRLQNNRVPTPSEIKSEFNSTAKQINDSSGTGLNFSRIDVFAAIDLLFFLSTSFVSPSNNSYINNETNFTCLAQTATRFDLDNVTFYLWNSTNDLIYNLTNNISGTTNSTYFNYSISSEEEHYWGCLSFNNNSNSSWTTLNYTITYDATPATINSISSSVSITTAIINVNSNELTNSSINYGTTTTLGTESTNASLATNHSFSLSSLSASTTYYYNITNCDRANNCVINGTNSFATDAVSVVVNNNGGGGGGGGGGVTTRTYIPSVAETTIGYTKSLAKDDKIKVTLFDGGNVQHTMTLDYVGTNSINLTIRSDPIKLSLGVGQSAKLNLSSSDYYDLYIKLNSITNNKADLVIQTIKEKMSNIPEITGDVVSEDGGDENKKDIEGLRLKLLKMQTIIYIFVVVFIIIIIFLFFKKKKYIKRSLGIKEYKERFKKIKPKK